jgi:N-acyl-D-amino-acid deacylase
MQRRDFVASALGAVAAFQPGLAVAEAKPMPAAGQLHPSLAPLDRHVQNYMKKWGIPAGTAAVAKDGRLVYARAFGHVDLAGTKPMTTSNRMRFASCAKPLTAVGIMQLVESGKLRLDERAFAILSDFAPPTGMSEDPRLRSITVVDLLEHVAGFDSRKSDTQFDDLRAAATALGHAAPATARDLVKYNMGKPLAFTPGTQYIYSNLGYNILGRIIEQVSGQSYGAYVSEHVLRPAGATRTVLARTQPKDQLPDEVEYWDLVEQNPMYSVYEDDPIPRTYPYGGFSLEATDAHGGWVADATDLTRFLNAVGGTSGTQVLKPDTVSRMIAKPKRAFYANATKYYALGWDVNSHVIMGHNGAFTWGTASTMGRIRGGVTFTAIFNRLGFDLNAFMPGMSNEIPDILSLITDWPKIDLYG